MQISFSGLNINKGFYDTHTALLRNYQTSESYTNAYSELDKISGNKNIELRKLSDFGAAVAEVDANDKVLRYISKDFQSAISAIKEAVLKLQNEDKAKPERKKPFEGHNLDTEG